MYEDKLGFLFLDYASINTFWFPSFVGALCCCRLRDDVRTLLVVLERTRWFVVVCLFNVIYQESTRLSRGYCCPERAAVIDGECPRYVHTTSKKLKGKRQKSVYRLVNAPQGGTQKYTLDFAYDSPR